MKMVTGIGASGGLAIGPAFLYISSLPLIEAQHTEDIEAEANRLKNALEKVSSDLQALETQALRKIGKTEAEIFAAQRMILFDPVFKGQIEEMIRSYRWTAETAVQEVATNLRKQFQNMENEYFRAREADVADISAQVIRALLNIKSTSLEHIENSVIIVADELNPSDTIRLDPRHVLGIVTARGGPFGHAAILARSLGIPAIVGADVQVLNILPGTTIIIDGNDGNIIINPDEETKQDYLRRQRQLQSSLSQAIEHATEPAVMLDGRRVVVAGNIGSISDADYVVEFGGEGVGLLRTEFLFLNRTTAPSEEEQIEVYTNIAKKLAPHPLIIRTLDVGGDKPLTYLPMSREENPFLGRRGIRLCLYLPELFKTQLRAILRVAHQHHVKIMFPMVTNLSEVQAAKKLMNEAREELAAKDQPYGNPEIGIMVEVPAVAIMANLFAPEVDFFSIGTNDLTQYTLAADRTNFSVQEIANHYHPAVLRLIYQTIQQAHTHQRWVGLCGELAGDPLATPLLLGMELDEFSMAPASIPLVKDVVRCWSLAEAKTLVEPILQKEDAKQVIAFLGERVKKRRS